MKKTAFILSLILVTTACAPDPSQNRYDYKEIGQSTIVDFATVVAVKEINITGRNTGAGALAGAGIGGGAGSYVGSGSGQIWAAAGGAVAGALVGLAAEQAAADKKGYEYVVVTEHKQTKTVAQFQAAGERVFKAGDRVIIQTSGTYQRVLPADNLPDTIKRPKGIKIVE
jgi:outer membrane lipoprotein SlyB